MNNKDYYNAMIKLIQDIDYYYNKKYPSKLIWEKTIIANETGEMVIPKNKTYFIYDENNFLKEENNSKRMQDLYKKQEFIYSNKYIKNYIFLVENIDESEEDLEICCKRLNFYISDYFGFTLYNSIIDLFSMNLSKIRIQPGDNIKNIFSDNIQNKMIDNLKSYMTQEKYYDGIIKLLEDIEYYYCDYYNNEKNQILENQLL